MDFFTGTKLFEIKWLIICVILLECGGWGVISRKTSTGEYDIPLSGCKSVPKLKFCGKSLTGLTDSRCAVLGFLCIFFKEECIQFSMRFSDGFFLSL